MEELGHKETRGRKPKVPPPIIHWRTQAARQEAAPKITEIMNLINKHFGGMRGFLKEWTENDVSKTSRHNFMTGPACSEVIELWLPLTTQVPEALYERVMKSCDDEVKMLLRNTSSPIRYMHKDQTSLTGTITASMLDMQSYVQSVAPLLWKIFNRVSTGTTIKPNAQTIVLTSILELLNCRNQQVNAFQTMMGIFLYANRVSKSTIEILAEMGLCGSYSHINTVLKHLAKDLKVQTASEAGK